MPANERHEVLLRLWEGTASRRSDRRSYEWRIALSVWTALLLTAAGLSARHDVIADADPSVVRGITALVAVGALVLHVRYSLWVKGAQGRDLEQAIALENELRDSVSLERVAGNVSASSRAFEMQVGITVLLAGALVATSVLLTT